MKHPIELLSKIALLAFTLFLLSRALDTPLPDAINLSIILGGILLVFPVVLVGRKILDHHPTTSGVSWITTFVQFAVGNLLALGAIRAVTTHRKWPGWELPVPTEVGMVLTIVTGTAAFLTAANLALKGFGAPFFIVLSKKLATDWMYAWTRNPMVLTVLAFLVSLGILFQSALFVLWVIILFAPALLSFVKVYEERELELRFGTPYLEYKSRTPMLFPRKPKSSPIQGNK